MNVNKAIDLLKQEGYKFTDKREELIRIFAKQKRYMTAKEVLDFMKDAFPSLSFDTIYRNLSLFSELGIIEETELNGERRYRFQCSGADEHHHHVICLSCGKTKHLEACPLEKMVEPSDDFVITGHKFEIYGYCKTCEI
ncbi:transcriptional repressor [Ammoniphilus oxalaticus]|uniref:Transcriptional repressor n=1 Tax=Ammoniphilus oxalaticus TaxID=66863 RepID=A0A419SJ32_9BACL|nr:Fur family transcriptional regulator [Ammoniphilus oxalaticus]RKD23962.1 transcriptional repressor [Ammoniphilus oxalaticus]